MLQLTEAEPNVSANAYGAAAATVRVVKHAVSPPFRDRARVEPGPPSTSEAAEIRVSHDDFHASRSGRFGCTASIDERIAGESQVRSVAIQIFSVGRAI